jgi:hypothetical protein
MPRFSTVLTRAKIPQIGNPAKGASQAGRAGRFGRQERQGIPRDRLQGVYVCDSKGKNLKTL